MAYTGCVGLKVCFLNKLASATKRYTLCSAFVWYLFSPHHLLEIGGIVSSCWNTHITIRADMVDMDRHLGVGCLRSDVIALAFLMLATVQTSHAQSNIVYNFPIGFTTCYSCSLGTYVGTEGAGTCQACQPGFYQDQGGSSLCKECPAGENCVWRSGKMRTS